MGSWGLETFEDDTACDFVGDVADFVIAALEKDLGRPRKEQSSVFERPALAAIAVLAVLAENIRPATFCVSQRQVHGWKKQYFDWLNDALPKALSPDDLAEARRIAEREFQRLLAVAAGE
jgi:hypothetical protein